MKTLNINKDWYSWIPTNLGILSFNYIADFDNLVNIFGKNNFSIKKSKNNLKKIIFLNETNLSDLNCIFKKMLEKEEIKSTAKIFIKKSNFNTITGCCNIKFSKHLSIKSTFLIELNGKARISIKSISYNDNINDINLSGYLTQILANACFTLIKKIVHGDNHHYQKIDTIIGIYETFRPNKILEDLGFQIKRIEKFVKNNDNHNFSIIYNKDKEYAYHTAKGFESYISTFYNLFEEELKENQILSNIKNVILSIEANINIIKLEKEKDRNYHLFIVSMLALFSTLNILYGSLITINRKSCFLSSLSINRDVELIISIFMLSFLLFRKNIVHYFLSKIRNLIRDTKKSYNMFELIIIYINIQKLDMETKLKYKKDYPLFYKLEMKLIKILTIYMIFFILLTLLNYYSFDKITYILYAFLSLYSFCLYLFREKYNFSQCS